MRGGVLLPNREKTEVQRIWGRAAQAGAIRGRSSAFKKYSEASAAVL